MKTDIHPPIQTPVRPAEPPVSFCPGLDQKLKGVTVSAPGFQLDMLLLSNQAVQPGQTVNGYLTPWVIPAGFQHLPFNGSTFGAPQELQVPLPLRATLCWDQEIVGELDHRCCMNERIVVGPHGCIPILRSKNDLLFFETENPLSVLALIWNDGTHIVEKIDCKVFMSALLPNFSTMYLGFVSREAALEFITKVYSPAEPGAWIEVGAPIWMEDKESFVAAYVAREYRESTEQ